VRSLRNIRQPHGISQAPAKRLILRRHQFNFLAAQSVEMHCHFHQRGNHAKKAKVSPVP
jgi:hypothetical protein